MRTLLISFTALSTCSPLAGVDTERPNILWLTFEDSSPHFIACYGNTTAVTPTIDQLASEGVRFTNAFANGAVSSASRFCLITGLRTSSMGTGNHRSSYIIPEQIKGFPYYLRQAGYYTTNNEKTDYNLNNARAFIREAWDESSRSAGWWNRTPGQPFFAVYNSAASHQSRTMTNSWSRYEKQVLQKLDSSSTPIPPENLPLPHFYRDSPEMQQHISRVYNSIMLMDQEFGEWLRRLENDGLKDSTIIFCFSDHGQGITRAKGSALGLGYRVPFIAWFPEMYKHLSPWGSGVITDELVSFEDMAPTVLKLAGVQIPEYMKGRPFAGEKPEPKREFVFSAVDRTDESSELSRSVTDGRYLFTRVFMPFQPFVRWNIYYDVSDMQKQVRSDYRNGLLADNQKWILEKRTSEYLFDLHNDPWEMVNLIENPKSRHIANKLRDTLIEQLIIDRDAHFIPEYTYKKSTLSPYQLASDTNYFPIERILNAALTIGSGNQMISHQLELLSDTNKFVRYWASVGLFAQQKGLETAAFKLEKQIKTEQYMPTVITLTMTLYKMTDNQFILTKAKQLIQQKDQELQRIALHLLTSLDSQKQLPLLETIRQEFSQTQNKKSSSGKLMQMLLHKHDGLAIEPEDSF